MQLYIIVLLSLNLSCWAGRLPYNEGRGWYYCPPLHEPTCATNGLNYVYFENKCNLDVRNYQEKRLGQKVYSECSLNNCYPKCKTCPNIEDPVCVIDGRTQQLVEFKNPCEVEFVSCSFKKYYRFLNHGPCPQQNKCSTTLCSNEYSPICVNSNSMYREFTNDCELQRALCANNMKWQTVEYGPCLDSHTQDHGLRQDLGEHICASFENETRTFQSHFQLEKEMEKTGKSWSILHTGPCEEKTSCRGKLIKPICAGLNNTMIRNFLSPCHLQEEKTKSGQNWVVLHQGLCRTLSTSYSSSNNVIETTRENGATSVIAVENDKSKRFAKTGVKNRNKTPKSTTEPPSSISDNVETALEETNDVPEETTKPTETTKGLSNEGIGKETPTTENSLDLQSSANDGRDLLKTTRNPESTSIASDRREDGETTSQEVNNEISVDQPGGKIGVNGSRISDDKSSDIVTPKQEAANMEVNFFSTESSSSDSDNVELELEKTNHVQEETIKPTETTKGLSNQGIGKNTETTESVLELQRSTTSSISNNDNELEVATLSDTVSPDDGQDVLQTTSNPENTSSISGLRGNVETEEVSNQTTTDQSGDKGGANGNKISGGNSFDIVTPKQETPNVNVNSFSTGTPSSDTTNVDTETNRVQQETTNEGTGKKAETNANSMDLQSSTTSSISNNSNELEFGTLSDAVSLDDGQDLLQTTSNPENASTTSDLRGNVKAATEEVNNETSTDQSGDKGGANADNSPDNVTPKQEIANTEVNSFSTETSNLESRNLDKETFNENSNESESTEDNDLPNRVKSNDRDISGNSVTLTETESDENERTYSSRNLSDESSENNETASLGDINGSEVTQNQESINENASNSGSYRADDVPKPETNNESASDNYRIDGSDSLQNTAAIPDSSSDGLDTTSENANDGKRVTENENGISTQSKNDKSLSENSGKSESSDQGIENVTVKQNTAAAQSSSLDSVKALSEETQKQLIETLRLAFDMYILDEFSKLGSKNSSKIGLNSPDANKTNEIPNQKFDKEITTTPVSTVKSDKASENEGKYDQSIDGNFSNNGVSNHSNTSRIFKSNGAIGKNSNNTSNRNLTKDNNKGNSNTSGLSETRDNISGRNAGTLFPSVSNDFLNPGNGMDIPAMIGGKLVNAALSPFIKIKEFVNMLGMLRDFVDSDTSNNNRIGKGNTETLRQEIGKGDLNSPDSRANNATASKSEAYAGSNDTLSNEAEDLNYSNDSPFDTGSFENNINASQESKNAGISRMNQEVENKKSKASANNETQKQVSNIEQLNTWRHSELSETSARNGGSDDATENRSSGHKGLPIQVSEIPDTSISVPGNLTLSQEANRSSLNTSENSDKANFSNLGSEIGNPNPLDNMGFTGVVTSDFLTLNGITESSVVKHNETNENLENSEPSLDYGYLSDAVSPDQSFSNTSEIHGDNTDVSSQGVGNINQNITRLKLNEAYAVPTIITNNTLGSLSENNTDSSSNTPKVIYNGAVYTAPASYSPTFNFINLPNGNRNKFPINPHEFWSILPSNFTANFDHLHTKPHIQPPVRTQQLPKTNVESKQFFKPPSSEMGDPFQHPKHNLEIEQPVKSPSYEMGVPFQHPSHNIEVQQPVKPTLHEIGVPYHHPKSYEEIGQSFKHPSYELGTPYTLSDYPLPTNPYNDPNLPVATSDENHQLPADLFSNSLPYSSPYDDPSVVQSLLNAPVSFPRLDLNYDLEG